MSRKKSQGDKSFSKTVGERIKKVRQDNGLTQVQFSKTIGISPNYLSDLELDKKPPSDPILLAIEYRYATPKEWLLSGKLPTEKTPYDQGKIRPSMVSKKRLSYPQTPGELSLDDKEFIYIPMVSGKISAGGGLIPEARIELRLAFRKDWIQRHGDPRNMSLIRVSGDSMESTLFSGDIVLVDHNRNYIDPQGGIYTIALDDAIMIKRLQLIYPKNILKIISDNPKYQTIEVSPDQIIVNGKVIWFGREIER
jgi:phage repressor protein C with HTH and peptisase S24 domain